MVNSNDLIVFYDGECGFCNRTVAFVLRHDKSKRIRFASIQSDFTVNLFEQKRFKTPDLSTFYFLENGVLYKKSTAALRLLKYFLFPLSLLRAFWIIPRFIRDGIYNSIAKRRKGLSKGYCVVPRKEDVHRFLG